MFTPTRLGFLPVAAVLSLAAAAGCSDSVDSEDIEDDAITMAEQQTGTRPESADCPELEAEEGANVECTLTFPDGTEQTATVTVSSVDGNEVRYVLALNDAAPDGTDPNAGDPAAEDPAAEDPAAGQDSAAGEQPAGGGTGGDTPTILQSYVESQAMSSLEESVGQRPSSIECPGDMEAVQGTTMRCTLTAQDGTQIGMTTEVTSVDAAGNFQLNFQVDDAPMP